MKKPKTKPVKKHMWKQTADERAELMCCGQLIHLDHNHIIIGEYNYVYPPNLSAVTCKQCRNTFTKEESAAMRDEQMRLMIHSLSKQMQRQRLRQQRLEANTSNKPFGPTRVD